jgi:hypothetical protein
MRFNKSGTIITVFMLLVATPVFAEECYKPAPWSEEKGYGYSEEVPCASEEDVWIVLKEWRIGKTREPFVDKDKDGECDSVYAFTATGEFNAAGEEMYMFIGEYDCDFIEKQIQNTIRLKNEKTVSD